MSPMSQEDLSALVAAVHRTGYPAFYDAMNDERLDTSLRVYLWCSRHLDFLTFRAFKLVKIAHDARARKSTVDRALEQLCRLGYLERGPRIDRSWSYRLVWSVARDCVAATSAGSGASAKSA